MYILLKGVLKALIAAMTRFIRSKPNKQRPCEQLRYFVMV